MLDARKEMIKGVNLGGWLLMEGYLLGGINVAESVFKEKFKKIYGGIELKQFGRLFRDNFITEFDFRVISLMGANSVRVPFNYRLIENKPYSYSREGLDILRKTFSWARKYNLGVILDLHAACGAQNHDWHADSKGKALLWENKEYQKRTIALWEVLADKFKNEKSLIGYDVLNEPVLGDKSTDVLKKFYKVVIKHIEAIDKNHLIFLEGDIWAQRIDFLKDLIAPNIVISIHAYQPLNYTFNFSPFLKFPGKIDNALWNENKIRKSLESYFKFSLKNKVKIFAGEFGVNWRGGFWGELNWLASILNVFHEFGFGYTYWTYKAIANSLFPDGLYQSIPNNPYINRQGPLYGWDTYLALWRKERDNIVDFWRTKNFIPNKKIIAVLSKFFGETQQIIAR